MCKFSDEQLREPKRWVTHLMVEQKSYGVAEDFSQQPAGKVPEIPGPYPLYGVTCGELRKDGVYPVAKTAQVGALNVGAGSRFLEEYGARSSMPICTSSSLVLGEW